MRILAVTNMYPTAEEPFIGTFVEQQIKGLRESGMEVDLLHVNRRREGMRSYFRVGAEACERIQVFHPHLVHVMYGGFMADQVTRAIRRCPTVVSFCGSDLLGELLSGWKRKFIAACGIRASWRAARRARGVIVKSKNLEAALPRSVDRQKVRIIPNGIDLERFKPMDKAECRRQLGWDRETFQVLFPANVGDPRKRPGLARAAVEQFISEGPKGSLVLLQEIPHHQVPIWLNASDCVLVTSLFEGSANVIKEALACNVPVVSVDTGDAAELLAGIEGCHLTAAEPATIAAKLRLVHQRGQSVQGREKMRDLSLARVAGRLRDFYQELTAV